MRDFRGAKALAHTLRAALAAKGLKVTVSQSLELIAQAFRPDRLEYSSSSDPCGGGWSRQQRLAAYVS